MLLIALLLAAAAPAQTQADMNRSAGASYAQADAAMTVQWKRTYAHMKNLDAQDKSRGGGFGYAAALLASQRAWLKFRDAQCVIQGGEFAGGSAQSMLITQCRSQLTRARTQQLKTLIWDH
jgi:uncharacterized protein YecT (DUF1311 family)